MLTATDLAARLVLARQIAREAGQLLLGHFRQRDRLVIDQKGVNDFVSNADKESEVYLFGKISQQFPHDRLLGEESGYGGNPQSDIIWAIDPLDGTSNFLRGDHNWCVSIGVFAASRPVLGVVYDPVRNEMYEGGQSLGVRVNGTDIRVSSAAEPGRSRIGLGHNARVQVADFTRDTGVLLRSGLSFSQVGAGALMLAYVAAGRIDAYFERHMLPWDAAAGLALIYEAGGVAHPYGRAEALENGGLVLASAPALHGLLCHSLGLNGGLDAGAKFGYD